jgi:hypothetical protein
MLELGPLPVLQLATPGAHPLPVVSGADVRTPSV